MGLLLSKYGIGPTEKRFVVYWKLAAQQHEQRLEVLLEW